MDRIIIIAVAACIIFWYRLKVKKINVNTELKNQELAQTNAQLLDTYNELFQKITTLEQSITERTEKNINLSFENDKLNTLRCEKQQYLDTLQNNIQITLKNQTELFDNAFKNYCDVLETQYQKKEQEVDNDFLMLQNTFEEKRKNLNTEIQDLFAELEKIKASKAAVMEAARKEKEIKEQMSFYCLNIKQSDLDDIKKLERIKLELHTPRILSMLIWSTFFQKSMTALCNNILGAKTVTGIYKITNQLNDMCYVGQAVDVSKRWKEHAKCGLGIDTPQGNKLYKAMIEDGIWNFSWELLEACPKEQLDEKERFYINLYQSKEYGYNTTAGNK